MVRIPWKNPLQTCRQWPLCLWVVAPSWPLRHRIFQWRNTGRWLLQERVLLNRKLEQSTKTPLQWCKQSNGSSRAFRVASYWGGKCAFKWQWRKSLTSPSQRVCETRMSWLKTIIHSSYITTQCLVFCLCPITRDGTGACTVCWTPSSENNRTEPGQTDTGSSF